MPITCFGDVDHLVGAKATPANNIIDQVSASVNAEGFFRIESRFRQVR
jgi:hypothetical protein